MPISPKNSDHLEFHGVYTVVLSTGEPDETGTPILEELRGTSVKSDRSFFGVVYVARLVMKPFAIS